MVSVDEYFSTIDNNDFHFTITTNNELAQKWFDRGMLFVYGFNHNEGIECFKEAIKHDPNCPMVYWAISNALHCNYNKWEVTIEEMNEINENTKKSCELSSITKLTQLENDLIIASISRNCYPYVPTDINIINKKYVDEMRLLWKNHMDNIEFTVLFIEGLMNLRPWKLWDNEMTLESVEITNEIRQIYSSTKHLVQTKSHPGYSHLFVHLMEMAPTKKQVEEALPYADDVRTKWPYMGHLVHMASHIEMSLGMYNRSVDSNLWAIKSDEKYAEIRGYDNYYHFYRCHNEHMLVWSAMFTGQYSIAYESARRIINLTPLQLLKDNIIFAESIHQSLYHVYIRFGKWDEILQEELPEDKDTFLITTTTAYYAKGIEIFYFLYLYMIISFLSSYLLQA
jgi:tetratricopeptide (TPR) repeat protein